MSELKRPGASLHYEVWGDSGPWVTLINGHTRPLNDFRLLGRFLRERGLRILTLDNRGAGETVVEADFSLDDMVADVVALWQHVGASKTRLLGISMGGFIAQKLAIEQPQRIERLALVSTAASQAWICNDDTPWSSDIEQVLAKLAPYFTHSFYQRNQMLVKSMAKQITKSVAQGDFVRRALLQKAAARSFDVRVRLQDIDCPTLVLHGQDDRVIPAQAAHELAGLLRASKLTVLPDAGHLLLAEKPKELYEAVSESFA